MKNVVKLQHYYFPWELEAELCDFVAYYNNERYLESPGNVTPADAYFGRYYEVLTKRAKIKQKTMQRRKKGYLAAKAAETETEDCLLARGVRCPDHFADVQQVRSAGGTLRYDPNMTVLNLGCGTKASGESGVVNIDWSIHLRLRRNPLGRRLAPLLIRGPRWARFRKLPHNIMVHNLARGIPFPDSSVDAVYHSHFLEHLDRDRVAGFLAEVKRVLRPGGVHRIVVPDFARLCSAYLGHWKRVLDSSGEASEHDNFVAAIILQSVRREAYGTSRQRPVRRFFENLLLGDARRRGETHQWMYDTVNLRFILEASGFEDVIVQDCESSDIPDWDAMGLDRDDEGGEYKPDSLYVEARKPSR